MRSLHFGRAAAWLIKAVFCGVIFATALYLLLLPILLRLPFRVPPPVAARAKARVNRLKPGMTERQVWSTLGLNGYGFRARVPGGSGPPKAFPMNYVLWPGYVFHARWNLHAQPPTLVEAEFRNRL